METAVEDIAERWVAAWTHGRTSDLFRLLAAAPLIESNLDPDGDFIEILTDYAASLDAVTVFSQTVIDGRVALVYNCTLGAETFRLAEFLVVDEVGLVTEVRRVYDLDAVERLLPDLLLGSS
ncbi:hypothetical protein ACFFX1_03030 [Dactylosporangium sucinum]|uniref:SnoaL-like domain-containing protein n=1 Tax=Dactylosporangium sucinum TaxID=1424081 RepID=A0A917UA01_9ACTN|nr:hypothetical protein [Dactylosporangium sucinum]GGM65069.1 hypothetical protein GCM10007977_078180 [Dactylosporangium sucinum]